MSRRFKVLLARELAYTAGVAQNLTFCNADPRLVRFIVVITQKLHRVGRHHRQFESRRKLHSGRHVPGIVSLLGALELNVKTVRKNACKMQRAIHGSGVIALHQRLTHSTALCARQSNQAFVELFKPFQANDGLRAQHPTRPGACDEFRQIKVTLVALHQQQQTGRWCAGIFAGYLHPDICPDQRFNTSTSSFFIKLDRSKQIGKVANGQRGLLVGCGCSHNFIDSVGAVNN